MEEEYQQNLDLDDTSDLYDEESSVFDQIELDDMDTENQDSDIEL